MELILFIGIQATGKSSFYKEHFFNSHVRISLDLLNTRNKQQQFMNTCFGLQTAFVVDNTNLTVEVRKAFLEQAKANKYQIKGYYFQSKLADSLARNEKRHGKERIPEIGIKGAYKKLELPTFEEGFDEINYVELNKGTFVVSDWTNEI